MVAGVGIAHDVDEVMSLVWELTPFPPYLSSLQATTLFVRTIIKKIFRFVSKAQKGFNNLQSTAK